MRIVKLLTLLIVIHLAMGFTQMSVSYFAGDVADYGTAGFVSHTPIGTFINLDAGPNDARCEFSLANPRAMFECANDLGDMINGLASFSYGFLTDIQSDAGMVYMLVIGFRIVSVIVWLSLGMALIYFLFDSNLLTSTLGLTLVGLGLGLGVLSATGIVQD